MAVLGPTNTGKTHYAVERMLSYGSGMIGLPLRLLAREIYDRVCEKIGPGDVALITGEEKIVPSNPRYYVCTVEAMPLQVDTEFLAIDEVQLCADPERGHVFTDRLLRARGSEETLFLGAETIRPLIRQLLPEAAFTARSRFSDLAYIGPKKISRLPRRSAIVAFSADAVYGIAELIRRQRGGAAVVMGALSPRTRNAQVALYQSGEVDFIVATDAIGMGLNMDIDHVAFASIKKFDGVGHRELRPAEIAQIAGRAGRHTNDGTFGPTGEVEPFDAELVEQIENHRFDPIRTLQWRNPVLDFSSVDRLIQSLEETPPARGLSRARAADDLTALKLMSENTTIMEKAKAPAAIGQLWEVCQIPDFQKTTVDEHVRLLTNIFDHLISDQNRLPSDWVSGHIQRLDRTDGDLDMIATRIAHIRTWTYVSNRNGWLEDQEEWQGRAREIEDRLSDALHEALTQRFIDRRTSLLMKRLQQNEDLTAEIAEDGSVLVEGAYAGKLSGFKFVPDPRALAEDNGIGAKTLRAAAIKSLDGEILMRSARLGNVPDETIQLTEHGKIWWEGSPIGMLEKGADPLSPTVRLLVDDLVPPQIVERIQKRLDGWIQKRIENQLAPLVALRDADHLTGAARGLAFQLVESMGGLPRREAAAQLKELDQTLRASLRQLGVRFGEYSVFLPALLKPAPAHLKALLWAVFQGVGADGVPLLQTLPPPPGPGLTSIQVDRDVPKGFYESAGFRVCGVRGVRIDMLERLAGLIRSSRDGDAPKAKKTDAKRSAEVSAPQIELTEQATDKTEAPVAFVAPDAASGETPEPSPAPVGPAQETVLETPASEAADAAPSEDTGSDEAASSPTDSEGENIPAPDAEPEVKPARILPGGCFETTADMMSLVGCSGDEFEAILKSLGYRKRPHTVEDGSEPVEIEVWHYQQRRPNRQRPNRKDAARKSDGAPTGKKQRHRKKPGGQGGADKRKPRVTSAGPRRNKGEADPNSPFAALAALRDAGKSGK